MTRATKWRNTDYLQRLPLCKCTLLIRQVHYIRNQTKGNFYKKISDWNDFLEKERLLTKEAFNKFLASVNSYLGIMVHYNTYKLRRKMLAESLSPRFGEYIYIADDYAKLVSKN